MVVIEGDRVAVSRIGAKGERNLCSVKVYIVSLRDDTANPQRSISFPLIAVTLTAIYGSVEIFSLRPAPFYYPDRPKFHRHAGRNEVIPFRAGLLFSRSLPISYFCPVCREKTGLSRFGLFDQFQAQSLSPAIGNRGQFVGIFWTLIDQTGRGMP